ncbi:MAG: hypothetical protein OXI87_10250 [Albidovulum sp.]|nr:hypothetical protein [Albidovulum sp.]
MAPFKKILIPDGASLLRLPAHGPELNSMENVFGHLNPNKLPNRPVDTAESVREAALKALTEFAGQPGRIASFMTRKWRSFRKIGIDSGSVRGFKVAVVKHG